MVPAGPGPLDGNTHPLTRYLQDSVRDGRWAVPEFDRRRPRAHSPAPQGAMPRRPQPSVRELIVELVLYAGLVVGYLWAVLLLIDDRVAELAVETGVLYAVVALALIVGQGFLLDIVVENLLRFVRSWMDGR